MRRLPLLRSFCLFGIVFSLFACTFGSSPGTVSPTIPPTVVPTDTFELPATEEPSIPPSTQNLIETALQTGEIDYPTSLLYRAYAFAGDSRLPTAYQAAENDGDLQLFFDLSHAVQDLPQKMLTQLNAFLVRPDDPDSIFNTGLMAGQSPLSHQIAYQPSPTTTPIPPKPCTSHWKSFASSKVPVRVSVCDTGTPADEANAQKVLNYIEKIWDPMIALMGPPLPDKPRISTSNSSNPDERIDFYLVPAGMAVTREGRSDGLDSKTAGAAVAIRPLLNPPATSGYALIKHTSLNLETIVHEFFHIQQYAHNASASLFSQKSDCQFYWFVEASATWAQARFGDNVPGVYKYWFVDRFQKQNTSLYEIDMLLYHHYSAFIWPLFMQQEEDTQDGSSIAGVWNDLGDSKTDSCAVAFDILDTQLPFEDNFHIFATRNLNWNFQGAEPVTPRYKDLDPRFPEGLEYMPVWARDPKWLDAIDRSDAPIPYAIDPPSLRAHYYHFKVGGDVGQITFDFSTIKPDEDIDIDAVVNISGHWELRSYTGTDRVRFCRTEPGQALEQIIFVFSNHSTRMNHNLTGFLEITPLEEPCNCTSVVQQLEGGKWKGSVKLGFSDSHHWQDQMETLSVNTSWEANRSTELLFDEVIEDNQVASVEFYTGSDVWSASWRDRFTVVSILPKGGQETVVTTEDAIGYQNSSDPWLNVALLKSNTCIYSFATGFAFDTRIVEQSSMGTYVYSGGGHLALQVTDIPLPDIDPDADVKYLPLTLSGIRRIPNVFCDYSIPDATRTYLGWKGFQIDSQCWRLLPVTDAIVSWEFTRIPPPKP